MNTPTLDQELAELDRAIRALEAAHERRDSPTYHRMLGKMYRKRAILERTVLDLWVRAAKEANHVATTVRSE